MAAEPSRRLCADSDGGIPHLVDRPRAERCDQHRAQRHRWSNANKYRTDNGLPLLPWVPDPLTPARRREALSLLADENARDIHRAVRVIRETLKGLNQVRPAQPRPAQHFDVGIARIEAMCTDLEVTAATMNDT